MPEELKQREIDIISLMKLDLTNRQIAERLSLSVETVRWYAKQIYAKLDVSGREEAVILADQLGWLDQLAEAEKTTPHNLPVALTSFVSRTRHEQAITELLQTQRLITLTGTGGTGKTRLATHIAHASLDQFPDGVYFIDLVPIINPGDIPQAIASVLEIHPNDDDPIIEIICNAIADRQILLLLDNYEHVIGGASIAYDLLTQTTNLKIIATSREILRVAGEQEYPVPPLVILNGGDTDTSESLKLFTQRAQLVKPSFQLTDSNRDDVLLICEKLDGLPLAIELVAAHMKILSPSAILKRMDKRITAFASQSLNTPDRHRTLYRTIDWSYQLLSHEEQQLFLSLSIFNDGAVLDAIEHIYTTDSHIDLFDVLIALIDKSMIRQYEDDLGEPRFYMLETLKAYARQCLDDTNQTDQLQRQYASFYMTLAQSARDKLMSSQQEQWFTRLTIEQNNIRQMLTWSLADTRLVDMGIQTIAALRNYWWFQGLHGEGWQWFKQGQNLLDHVSSAVRAEFLLAGAFIAYFQQDAKVSMEWGQSALELYTALDDEVGIAWCYLLPTLGRVASFEQTVKNYNESLALLEQVDDPVGISLKHNSFALLYMDMGMYDKAEAHYLESHRIAGDCGNYRQQNSVMSNLGDLAFRQRRYDVAAQRLREAISQVRDINFGFELHHMLWTTVWLMTASEELETAIRLYGAAQAREHRSGQKVYPNQLQYVREYGAYLDKLQETDTSFADMYNEGYNMSPNEAIDYALDRLDNLEQEHSL